MRSFRASVAMVGRLRRCQTVISSWAGLGPAAPGAFPKRAEPLRAAMRAQAGQLAPAGSGRLCYAIDMARDVTGLWHLRITLMQALAAAFGEQAARERIAGLDVLFLQVWPTAPVLRA